MKATRKLSLLWLVSILTLSTVWANPCDLKSLPEPVLASLAKDYSGWIVITPNELSAEDRETWRKLYFKECPGMIAGKFSGDREGYALNLVKKVGAKTYQQIVYYQPTESSFTIISIFPRTAVGVVTVLRKFPPGIYKPFYGGKSVSIKTATIGVSEIDAGTIVYYWDQTKFRSIITSD